MKKKFNYHNEDECIKYEKFFMIFYEVFKQYHYKESCNVIAYMGDRTNEEREEMLLKKQKFQKKLLLQY